MSKLQSIFGFLLVAILTFGFIACEEEVVDPIPEPQSIAQIAAGDSQFSTLVSALERVNLVSVLDGAGSFTVFAPTNAAFQALGVDLNTLSDEALTEILLYHVLGGKVASTDLQVGQTYATTATETGPGNTQLSILIEKDASGNVTINGSAKVTAADVSATNGVIHIVDGVLLPLDVVGHAAANSNFTELVGALGAANGNLVTTLQGNGPWTVFAPLNSAFEAISGTVAGLNADQLASVLTYHVVPNANVVSGALTNGMMVGTVQTEEFTVNIDGSNVTITDASGNKANVVLTDVQATNGVIHLLDAVLIPTNL
ncbi:MAG: fasciclin domain-containing protein [Saprospirales bacterium]|nr:fasciclin domain-containing protein [Saprospirales bacterium]